MGTKKNPGEFDCYSKAEPDEPMFVLLGRDPVAPILIALWVQLRMRLLVKQGKDASTMPPNVLEATQSIDAFERWAIAHGKAEDIKLVFDAVDDTLNGYLAYAKDQEAVNVGIVTPGDNEIGEKEIVERLQSYKP